MKKVLFFLALSGFLFSCSSPSTPEAVAEKFIEKLAVADFDGAKKYATKGAAAFLDMAKGMGEELTKGETFPDYTFKMVDKKVDGDNAVITYINPDGKEDKIELKKVDGKWLVAMEK